jgi:hypothetical protein
MRRKCNGKHEGINHLGNLGIHRIIIFKEVECENVDCFDMVVDIVQWHTFMNMVMSHQVIIKGKTFDWLS